MNDAAFGVTDGWTLGVIVGMTGVTVLARCFFFILDKPWSLPHWARRGLQYAPIAALAAVVMPEIVMAHGALIDHWGDARLFAAIAGAAAFYWRHNVFHTIVLGMAVYLPLHLGFGW